MLIYIFKSSCANLQLHFVRKSSLGLQRAISAMQLLLIITVLLLPAKGKGQWASIRRVASPIVYMRLSVLLSIVTKSLYVRF